MSVKSLIMIYYALFNSIISYGIIAWGGAYGNVIDSLQAVQNRIIKIIDFAEINKVPFGVKKTFRLESLFYYFYELSDKYQNIKVNTRKKNISLPKLGKAVIFKSSYIIALKTYNELPYELKKIKLSKYKNMNKKYLKNKLRTALQNMYFDNEN